MGTVMSLHFGVAGCWLLAVVSWLLAAACWLLAAAFWLLAAGCWLLISGCWLRPVGDLEDIPNISRHGLKALVGGLQLGVQFW